jgi:hypothetical protein
MRRPGRNRPSLIKNSTAPELEDDDVLDEDRDDPEARGRAGEVAVAKSMVARSSVLGVGGVDAGRPQLEQKRTPPASSAPQAEQVAMSSPRTEYRSASLPSTGSGYLVVLR